MRKRKGQNRKVNFIEVKCNVSENVLAQIAKLTNSSLFISLGRVCKMSELSDTIEHSKQLFVTSITHSDEYDIVINTNIHFFNEMLPLLFVNETEVAEVVIIDFPFDTTTFAQFLYNNNVGVQGLAVKKELCCLTCTWVTEDNSLLFWYDDFQGAEMFVKIIKILK